MDTYMMDPARMSDEQLMGWVANFRSQPPTMDYMGEWSWAGRVFQEARTRGLV
jgi:hypothetical protein